MNNSNINIEIILFSRNRISKLIKGLTNDQLTTIPVGLDHSIIWNIGHILAMHQIVINKASGHPVGLKEEFIEKYKTGSSATTNISDSEIIYLKDQLLKSLESLKNDYTKKEFKHYNPFTTKAGISVKSIEDAISFHAFHEGIHLGWIMEIKKLV